MCCHYFKVNSKIIKGWSLAKCKKCYVIEAFRNYYTVTKNGKAVSPSSIEKRDFLHSQGIRVSRRHWSEEERTQVIASVSQIGVNATAKKFRMSPSTVGLWAKGRSPKQYKGNKYTVKFKKEVAAYAEKSNNNYGTAKRFQVARGAVQNWRRLYLSQ
tara:strand:+ start:3810 stop:4280 length:471 start_codon:yes stop_codon:yes gene_type:complete